MEIQNSNSQWFSEHSMESGTAFSLETETKLHEEQSPYQNIEIYKTKSFGNLMVIDGFIMLSSRDNFIYHEMMSHPTLFSHSQPKHVVIVGGGDCGTLQQVAQHECVEKITQIEIDESVTRLSEQYFPELCSSNNDDRVTFEFKDAIEWIAKAQKNSIDVIIIDSTDPIGPAEGLFRKEFYQDCWSALREDGLIVQQSESPLIHWESITRPMHIAMQAANFKKTKTLFFPQPVYPTGWWSATIAAKTEITFSRELECKNLSFNTKYYNYDIHFASFATPSFLLKYEI